MRYESKFKNEDRVRVKVKREENRELKEESRMKESRVEGGLRDVKTGKIWDEELGIDNYLELIQENDEKNKFLHEVFLQNAAIDLNYSWKQSIKNIENTHQREREFYRDRRLLFETRNGSQSKDFFKSFSEKQLFNQELSPKIPLGSEKLDNLQKRNVNYCVKKTKTTKVPVKNSPTKVIKLKKHIKKSPKAPPMILTKAESYLKKQSEQEKSSKTSPKSKNPHRYIPLEPKLSNKMSFSNKNSPKSQKSNQEIHKTESFEAFKASSFLQSPKRDQMSLKLPSMFNSQAYNRAVSFRNYLKKQQANASISTIQEIK